MKGLLKTTERPRADLDSYIELDDRESAELLLQAQSLAQTPPGLLDSQEWMLTARARSCELPARLREGLRRFRSDPGADGVLRVRGLPAIGGRRTPTEPDSVEREASTPASALVLCAMGLGEVVAYRPEKRGAVVQNVVPVPGCEKLQSNAGSEVLEMHVENAFHAYRPDFVTLSCLRADHGGNAKLKVACIRKALALISLADWEVLSSPRFQTSPPPSFGDYGENAPVHPVLAGAQDDPNLRVDFASTQPLDKRAASAIATLREALGAVCVTIPLAPGELAIVDNRVAVHGRTAFTPQYDGYDRWLQRVFVHLDPRRSRGARPAGGHVIG